MIKPTIVIDSREQTPLIFPPDVLTVVDTLNVGDYSIRGLEDRIIIERKSLSDLLGCIGRDRERFVRELRQLRSCQVAILLIESRWSTVCSGLYGVPSQITPAMVIGSLMAFASKYKIVPIMAEDHQTAAEIALRLLTTFARSVEKDYRALCKGSECDGGINSGKKPRTAAGA